MIEKANQRSKQKEFPVQFRVGDIHKLDLADNTFDGCRADRVFMHLHDRQQALSDLDMNCKQSAQSRIVRGVRQA